MDNTYDVIVVGLGAMGSAALYQLSKRGVKVLGIDQYDPPHSLGSTHGDTRITRLAIGEGRSYVPLVQRSHEIWREIEESQNLDLLTQNGIVIMAEESNAFLQETLRAAEEYSIEHEILESETLRERFPQFKTKTEMAYLENSGGFVRPEAAVSAQLNLARHNGAEIKINTEVQNYKTLKNGLVEVVTKGETFLTKKMILSSGPWVSHALQGKFSKIFQHFRQVLYWYDIEQNYEDYLPENFPCFIWELPNWSDDKTNEMYGFASIDGKEGGLKVAFEQFVNEGEINSLNRTVKESEINLMYERYIKPYFRDLGSKCIKSAVCMYTITPDNHLIMDFVPDTHESVYLLTPCSHGFKHSAAMGEVAAIEVLGESNPISVDMFRLDRFI